MGNTLRKPKFHCFSNLPPEIRVMVWEFACQPEKVTIAISLTLEHERITSINPQGLGDCSVLYTCHESRNVALKHLRRYSIPVWWGYHGLYLNPNFTSLDIIYYIKSPRIIFSGEYRAHFAIYQLRVWAYSTDIRNVRFQYRGLNRLSSPYKLFNVYTTTGATMTIGRDTITWERLKQEDKDFPASVFFRPGQVPIYRLRCHDPRILFEQ
ncbi:hypothetical protein CC78DRAFT_575850 [Lojkania enalia]|uniref:2EXR domain-containing protein n=1 Tax=Lojkania enalia TaxID=147567 RepID=A0A9P4KID0_9PLEO|nr:hypothetical protein CC78DRAFT_575850 [Didymosphaeria enalia]